MASSSRGRREWGTKALTVKLQSKNVNWRLEKEVILCTRYIEGSINEVLEDLVLSIITAEMRTTVDCVNIL